MTADTLAAPRSPRSTAVRKKGPNLEKWGWVFMRVSGVLLIVLIFGHLFTNLMVGDGISALDLASSGDFDLLILDVGLPRMDGFQVLKALRAMDVQLPILMVTARSVREDIIAALECGVNNYIVKPFTPQVLKEKIDQLITARAAA